MWSYRVASLIPLSVGTQATWPPVRRSGGLAPVAAWPLRQSQPLAVKELEKEFNELREDVLIFYNVLYYIVLYYIILYYTILYYTILYYTILYYTILYYTIITILYYIISYHIISYHIISYHIISYHIISYHIILYHMIWYNIILYYTISYYVIFRYNIYIYTMLSCIVRRHQGDDGKCSGCIALPKLLWGYMREAQREMNAARQTLQRLGVTRTKDVE